MPSRPANCSRPPQQLSRLKRAGRLIWAGACGLALCPWGARAATPVAPSARPAAAVDHTPPALKARAVDLDGAVHVLGDAEDARPAALVFLSTDCPICNRYVPELNRLAGDARKNSCRLLGVISDPTLTRAAAAKYAKEHAVEFPLLFDGSGTLAAALKPTHTPEAFVLDARGAVRYRGRIDDANADLGKPRANVSHHELQDALSAVGRGTPVGASSAPPVGCFFEAWDKKTPGGLPEKVTYSRDVAPVFNANCVACHRPGEIAPFSLQTYGDAAKKAKQIARVTGERLMPPWKAEPNFGHFTAERRIGDREVALIAAWVNGGAPEGDPADLPPAPKFSSGWALGEPDLVLKMPAPITVPASGRDVFRAVVMPANIPEDKYVVAFEFKPGAKTVLHHALFFLDNNGAARKLEQASKDGMPGYHSFGGPGFVPSGGLGGWAPGAAPGFLPQGVGRPIKKGADVVFQVHYHPDGTERQDQSSMALYFAKKPVEKVVRSFPLGNQRIDIPAGDSHYVKTASITSPWDVTLIGLVPHMHLVGKEMKVTATLPDGTVTPLIYIKDWDFRWQDQYQLAEPLRLPAGTRVDLEAVYDNSAGNPSNPNSPPQRVVHGEQTTNEMCFCFLQLATDNPANLFGAQGNDPARREMARKWLEGIRKNAK